MRYGQDIMKNARFIEHILDISRQLITFNETRQALNYLISTAVALVEAERGFVVLVDQNEISLVATSDDSDAPPEFSQTIIDRVREQRKPLLVTDAMQHPALADAASVQQLGLRSIMCVPMIARERTIGILYVENRSQAAIFHRGDLETLLYFVGQMAVLIQNIRLADHLRASREAIVTAREEERRRLRRDLHDNIGPQIAALRMQLQAIDNRLADADDAVQTSLHRAQAISQQVLTELRRVIHDLRPPALDEWGLVYALREHLQQLNIAGDTHFQLDVSDDMVVLTAAMDVALYHITREAVTNVVRHSNASHCNVRIYQSDCLVLSIVDDGDGFDTATASGMGLRSIRERVSELRGTFQLETATGAGVRIHIEFPLSSASTDYTGDAAR
jgi:signal transduction histidine kinase